MMAKTTVTFEIDGGVFFDAVLKIGQEGAGQRLLETMLSLVSDGLELKDDLALALYGIEQVPSPAINQELAEAREAVRGLANALETICKGSAYEIGWASDGKDYGVAKEALEKHAAAVKRGEGG